MPNRLFRWGNFPSAEAAAAYNYYVCAQAGNVGVLRSLDGGTSWARNNTGYYAWCIFFHPVTGDVYVGGYDIRRSQDGGDTWTQVLQYRHPWQIIYNPSDGYMYAFLEEQESSAANIFRSTNGTSWARFEANPSVLYSYMYMMDVHDDIILVASGDGLVVTENDFSSVTVFDTGDGIPNNKVRCARKIGSNWWVATHGGGVAKSSNSGANWTTYTDAVDGIGNDNCIWLSHNPQSGRIFLTNESGVYITDDDGDNWSESLSLGLAVTYRCNALDGHVLIGHINHVYYSQDDGDNWTTVTANATYGTQFHRCSCICSNTLSV
jgi:photosystem II stability/assembly factor-like uncharacterized protein